MCIIRTEEVIFLSCFVFMAEISRTKTIFPSDISANIGSMWCYHNEQVEGHVCHAIGYTD